MPRTYIFQYELSSTSGSDYQISAECAIPSGCEIDGGTGSEGDGIVGPGEERPIAEMPLPRVSAARLVPPAIRARLAGEAAACC